MQARVAVDETKPVARFLDKALVIGYILLMTINFLGDLAGFPRSFKLASVAVVGIAFLRFIILFDRENVRYTMDYFMLISIPVALVLSVSAIIWLSDLVSFSDMLDASERLLVQAINIFVAIAAVYLFRGATMRYTLYAMSIAYGYIVFRAVMNYGVAEFIQSMIRFVLSLGVIATGAMSALEVHDMTFAFGFFLVYYLCAPKGEPKRLLCCLLSGACFILGYKRIALLGVVLAVLYNWYFNRIREKEKPKALMRFCAGIFLFCYAYLFFTRYGVFARVMEMLGVNTMGRTNLYEFFNKYYDISPTFKGYGFNFVRTFLIRLQGTYTGPVHIGAGALHNEVVRQYIELGFWGYLIWSAYELLIRPKWMLDKHGLFSSKVYVLCTIYIFSTYLTDNTMYYYHTAFAYRLVPLVCAQMYHDQTDQKVAGLMKGATVEKRTQVQN